MSPVVIAVDSRAEDARYRVGSVARAMELLELVAESPGAGLSLTQIARTLGVSKSTAYALIQTLIRGGHLRSVEPGPRYLPGSALMRLGDVSRRRYRLATVSQPVLDDLARGQGILARVVISQAHLPVTVAVSGDAGVQWPVEPLGTEWPPHCTAIGKAMLSTYDDTSVRDLMGVFGQAPHTSATLVGVDELLADLDRARHRGFALEDGEFVEGLMACAVALVDASGRCAGAVGVSGPRSTFAGRRLGELGLAVREAGRRIATLLG